MAKIVESLKKIYTANGGQASDVARVKGIAAVLEKISKLTLGGGGGSDFVVTYTVAATITADKTLDEILEAIAAGKNVKAVTLDATGAVTMFNLAMYQSTGNDKRVLFFVTIYSGDNVAFCAQISHTTSGIDIDAKMFTVSDVG